MSGIKYLLDTNIIIGMFERNPAVINLFKENNTAITECAYSSITRMELLGFPDITQHEIKIISALLEQMTYIGVDGKVEDKTIHLKQQHRIKLPDAIILEKSVEFIPAK